MERPPGGKPKPVTMGSDGIAISHDGSRLFYCPLVSRRLYSVSIDALIDSRLSDSQVAATVHDHGEKGLSDGLESDDKGRVYATNYEQNGIIRRAQTAPTRRWCTTHECSGRTRCRWRATAIFTSRPINCTARPSTTKAKTCARSPMSFSGSESTADRSGWPVIRVLPRRARRPTGRPSRERASGASETDDRASSLLGGWPKSPR